MTQSIDNQDRDRIIRKIQRCLDLSKSSNEHEAAAALRQAKKLMQMHRLTEVHVKLSSVGRAYSACEKPNFVRWERLLASTVATTFNCECIFWYDRDNLNVEKARVLFIGVSPAQEIAKYAYDTLHTKASNARREYVATIRRTHIRGQGPTPATRGSHFAESWVSQVYRNLRALVPEVDNLSYSNSKAVAVAESKDKDLIAEFIKYITAGQRLTPGRRSTTGRVNPADAAAGRRAGQAVELHHGVATGGKTSQVTHQRGTAG